MINREAQIAICTKYNAEFLASPRGLKIGVAENLKSDLLPINGLRHPPRGDTTGWYLWAGEELSSADDFFKPLHVEHISNWNPDIEKYLGLAPGWRFLFANGYEDVWYDASLLDV